MFFSSKNKENGRRGRLKKIVDPAFHMCNKGYILKHMLMPDSIETKILIDFGVQS